MTQRFRSTYPLLAIFAIPCSLSSGLRSPVLHSQENCRAAIPLGDTTVCFSQRDWLAWLSSHYPTPTPALCGSFQGNWKLTSPLALMGEKKKIHYTFYVSQLPTPIQEPHQINPPSVPLFWKSILTLRQNLSQELAPLDPWGVLRQLLLGEQVAPSPLPLLGLLGFAGEWMASGIHLYALGLSLSFLIEFFGWQLGSPSNKVLLFRRVIVFIGTLWAWVLAGARGEMLRVLLLLALRKIAPLLGFRWRRLSPLVIVLFMASFVDTRVLRNLSLGEFSMTQELTRLPTLLALSGALLTASSQPSGFLTNQFKFMGSFWALFTLFELGRHGLFSLGSLIIGWVWLPLIAGVVYPWLLLEATLGWLGYPFHTLLPQVLNYLLEQTTHILVVVPTLWMTPAWAMTAGGLLSGVGVVLVPRKFFIPAGLLGLLIALCIRLGLANLPPSITRAAPASEVVQLDVGQGDAALVISTQKSEAGLIDTGSAHALGDATWIRALGYRQINHLHWVALTHLDEDHRGGLAHLSKLLKIDCVATSQQEWDSPQGQSLARLLREREIKVATLPLCVPYPSRTPTKTSQKHNLQMSAFLVPLNSKDSYFSAGDAERNEELELFSWANQWILTHQPKSGLRILKISHHGSTTSSSPHALQLFHPDMAWLSVGEGNHYGHPAAETLFTLRQLKIPFLRTDQAGTFTTTSVPHRPPAHLP